MSADQEPHRFESLAGNREVFTLRLKRRKGSSLIVVLLVSLCGMFITGGVLSMFGIFSGAARRSVSSDMVYNFLEEEVEKAKGALKMEMG